MTLDARIKAVVGAEDETTLPWVAILCICQAWTYPKDAAPWLRKAIRALEWAIQRIEDRT